MIVIVWLVYEKLKTEKSQADVDFVQVSFSVSTTLLSLFDKESKMRGYTRSEALRSAMRAKLEVWTGRRL